MVSPTPRRIVIVGGGVAAHECATHLRRRGFTGSVTVVCGETQPPYDRTLLSKEYLEGYLDGPELALAGPAGYQQDGIEVLLNSRAAGLDPAERVVRLADGRALGYDRLVIATGGKAVCPPDLDSQHAYLLRGLADTRALRDRLDRCRRLVIVGGSFLGCEVAAAATSRGVEVTLVESGHALLAAELGSLVGARISALHHAYGVQVRAGTPAVSVRPAPGDRAMVTLRDGTTYTGDAAVVAAGMTPDVNWLVGTGTGDLRGGIRTDASCRTALPHVFAAGDCTRRWSPQYQTWLPGGHWHTAAVHGAAAASGVLDQAETFDPLPYFWSVQHGLRLQQLGYPSGWDTVDIEDDTWPGTFTARYLRQGRLAAVLSVGMPEVIPAARQELLESRGSAYT